VSEALLAAVGIAASPFAIIPGILLLFTARPTPTSASFASGWWLGVAAVTALAVVLADVLTLPDAPPRWAAVARVVFGAALVVLAVHKYLRRTPEAGPPGWMNTLEQATPRSAFRFGLIATAPNPKVALLAVAGGFALGAQLSGLLSEVVGVVGFALVATLTALVPLVLFLLRGAPAVERLRRSRDWLVPRADVVTSVVLLLLGGWLIWKGLDAL
jgi:threonine/homoserine/homoserine lactone efflux protein